MKNETKVKYQEMLSGQRRLIMGWFEEYPEREEELQALFEKVRKIENDLIDGTFGSTILVSNRIQGTATSIERLRLILSGEDVEGDSGETPAVEEVVLSDMGVVVMEKLGSCQGILLDLYEQLMARNTLAIYVAEIQEIKGKAMDIAELMRKLGKMGANL